MDYNQFRIWIGRLFGVALLLFAQNPFNFYAIGVILLGAVIRFWATGYIHKDREVTMAGPYKLLRHPLYLGNFLEGLGLTLFVNVWQLTLLYIPLFFIIYYKKMKLEEQFLIDTFGDDYVNYKEITPRFIPKLSNLAIKDNIIFNFKTVIVNREHLNIIGLALIIIVFILYQNNFNLIKTFLSSIIM